MKKSYNSGLSLVEVIIVVAIISVLTGTLSFGLSMSSGKAAEECARKLASELQSIRTSSMGKYEITAELCYSKSSGYTLKKTVRTNSKDTDGSLTETVVGASNVTVSYYNGSSYTDMGDGDSITFKFSRSTGALDDSCYRRLKISKANKTMYIDIVPLTGKVSVSSTAP